MTDCDVDNLPPEWEDALRFAEKVRKLDEPQQAYIKAMMDWLEGDESGEVLRLLKHYQATGERVCDTYFDMASREVRTLEPGEPVPERWEPILGPFTLSC